MNKKSKEVKEFLAEYQTRYDSEKPCIYEGDPERTADYYTPGTCINGRSIRIYQLDDRFMIHVSQYYSDNSGWDKFSMTTEDHVDEIMKAGEDYYHGDAGKAAAWLSAAAG